MLLSTKLMGSAMFYIKNFNLVKRIGLQNPGKRMSFNNISIKWLFCYRNVLGGVDTLSKIVDAFLSKTSKFDIIRIIP